MTHSAFEKISLLGFQSTKFQKKFIIFFKLAKRRASPGYARDRGFGSSGKFWEISFV